MVQINKELNYDCYAYLSIDNPLNTYPIRNAEHHLEQILSLELGDVLHIKGKGKLVVVELRVDDYPYVDSKTNKKYLYQDIEVSVATVY